MALVKSEHKHYSYRGPNCDMHSAECLPFTASFVKIHQVIMITNTKVRITGKGVHFKV